MFSEAIVQSFEHTSGNTSSKYLGSKSASGRIEISHHATYRSSKSQPVVSMFPRICNERLRIESQGHSYDKRNKTYYMHCNDFVRSVFCPVLELNLGGVRHLDASRQELVAWV
jgi:hypothetical protein